MKKRLGIFGASIVVACVVVMAVVSVVDICQSMASSKTNNTYTNTSTHYGIGEINLSATPNYEE